MKQSIRIDIVSVLYVFTTYIDYSIGLLHFWVPSVALAVARL